MIPATVTEMYGQIKGKRTKEIHSVQAHGSSPLPPQDVLQELYAIAPNAAFFTSISVAPTVDPDPVEQKYPKLLSTLRQDDSEGDISKICDEVYASYSVSHAQASNLEMATRNQNISPLWYQHRMGRITASKAHDVFVRKDSTPPDNLVRRISGYSVYDLSKNAAVKWGTETEEECRQVFSNHQKINHLNFKCALSGFVIDPTHPFLGVSPDGIIICDCCGKGVLEIKCPYKHRDIPVEEAAKKDKDLCLDQSLQLKKGHQYYTQVQLQMCITNCQYCDFVVFTKCNPSASMVIVWISIDEQFCKILLEKCELFMKDHVLKELITEKLEEQPTSRNKEVEIDDNNNHERTTWCICNEPEYGRMIKCESEDCPYQWFHYPCVSIRRKPRGQWFCASCDK